MKRSRRISKARNVGYSNRIHNVPTKRIVKSKVLKETLKKEENKIKGSNYEWQLVVSLDDGRLVDKWSDYKTTSVSNKYLDESYYKNRKNLISVHSHPSAFIGNVVIHQSLSPEDIINLESDSFGGRRVTEFFITHIVTPREGRVYGEHSNSYYYGLYRQIWREISNKLQQQVNNGHLTLKYYYNNIENMVGRKMLDILGWNYIIRKNMKPAGDLIMYKEEVIPPWELPTWLNTTTRNKYLDKWKKACEKYPELKQLKRGQNLVSWATPIRIDGKRVKPVH